MKFFKKIFIFLLALPLALGFVSCGKKDNGDGGDTPGQEQTTPETPSQPSNVFYVSYDYNLPDDYKFLLTNPGNISAATGTNFTCLPVNEKGLGDYFLGWYKGEEAVSVVTAGDGETISLKAKWNEEALKEFYYSTGMTFETSTESGNTATVSSYTGSEKGVVIPKTYKHGGVEYKVNAIDDSVFEDKNLTNVVCNAEDYSIGNKSFKGSRFANYDFSEVVSIGSNAFENCINLKKINLTESVESIGDNVFNGCFSVEEIQTASLYRDLGRNSRFIGYIGDVRSSVKKVVITGDDVTIIPTQYFDGWTALERIELGENVEQIGLYCFRACEKLEHIGGLEGVNPETFSKNSIEDTKYFKNLNAPMILQDVLIFAPTSVGEVVSIREGVTKIQMNAFENNTTIKEVNIPSTVVSIGDYAFSGCLNLEKVNFASNSNLTVLEDYVFAYCGKLATINMENLKTLKTISANAFDSVVVSNFVIPSTVQTIASSAFYNAKIVSFAFSGISEYVDVEDGVLYTMSGDDKTLVCYPRLKEDVLFAIPTDVTKVDKFAFRSNKFLRYVYVSQQNLTFGSTSVFDGTLVSILTESSNVYSPSFLVDAYYLSTEGIGYSLDLNGLTITTIDSTFEPVEDFCNYFLKIEIAGAEPTYRYFTFAVEIEYGEDTQIVTFVEGSIVEITEYFA